MTTRYFSVRMHASADSLHVSGAERIVTTGDVTGAVTEVVQRAFSKVMIPGTVSVTIDDLGVEPPRSLSALDVTPVRVASFEKGREFAVQVLERAGVAKQAARRAVELLSRGAGLNNRAMRGAMIIDAQTGDRLETDRQRGVRASRFDWSPDAAAAMRSLLEERGLGHFRTREALALATKIVHGPSVVAELCWSDDPDYCAGYAASLAAGYVRISSLKQAGDERGGRAVFVDGSRFDLELLVRYLEREPVLIGKPGLCRTEQDMNEYNP